MTTQSAIFELQRLARRYGVQTAYYNMDHRRQQASAAALLAVLNLLGAPVVSLRDVPAALRERERELWQRPLEPVAVAWEGAFLKLQVRLPADRADASLSGYLVLDAGESRTLNWRAPDLPVLEATEVDGIRYVTKPISIPTDLPQGYHRFTLDLPGKTVETLLISAPIRAHNYQEQAEKRFWGVFLPLYSLHTERSWGGGDLSELERLVEWTAEMGGSVVATLPVLPIFLDDPCDPSPYTPVSRLAWNEFYVDVSHAPELDKCAAAQALLSSSSFLEEVERLRSLPLVDYQRQMVLKREILEELSRCCFANNSRSLESLRRFTRGHPEIEDYARFRAACEGRRGSWHSWPQPLREGVLTERDYDEVIQQYYLYTQWLLDGQIESLSKKAQKSGAGICLDYPLGVHPGGYDVWRYQDMFIHKASVGAPPDPVFKCGQNWCSPPLHPEKLRQRGYDYYIACLRHHLRYAGMLRIDHIMGLHRLFIIPEGMEPAQGVYVRYSPEEFYAILSLESKRARALIVGEDLGTVPPDVRPAMRQHSLHRSYVVQYELCSDSGKQLPAVPRNAVASLNTHDMPPFAAFWQGLDIKQRLELNLLNRASARVEANNREAIRDAMISSVGEKGWPIEKTPPDQQSVLKAALSLLSASKAAVVLVNLEDLWLDTEPQNVPGTEAEHPNWRRKARYGFETFCQLPAVVDVLREVDRIRKQGVDNDAGKR
jgi:4-alpha-glucanotransferase